MEFGSQSWMQKVRIALILMCSVQQCQHVYSWMVEQNLLSKSKIIDIHENH